LDDYDVAAGVVIERAIYYRRRLSSAPIQSFDVKVYTKTNMGASSIQQQTMSAFTAHLEHSDDCTSVLYDVPSVDRPWEWIHLQSINNTDGMVLKELTSMGGDVCCPATTRGHALHTHTLNFTCSTGTHKIGLRDISIADYDGRSMRYSDVLFTSVGESVRYDSYAGITTVSTDDVIFPSPPSPLPGLSDSPPSLPSPPSPPSPPSRPPLLMFNIVKGWNGNLFNERPLDGYEVAAGLVVYYAIHNMAIVAGDSFDVDVYVKTQMSGRDLAQQTMFALTASIQHSDGCQSFVEGASEYAWDDVHVQLQLDTNGEWPGMVRKRFTSFRFNSDTPPLLQGHALHTHTLTVTCLTGEHQLGLRDVKVCDFNGVDTAASDAYTNVGESRLYDEYATIQVVDPIRR